MITPKAPAYCLLSKYIFVRRHEGLIGITLEPLERLLFLRIWKSWNEVTFDLLGLAGRLLGR